MSQPSLDEAQLAAALERAGISLEPDRVRDLLPGAAIIQRLIDQVNLPLPREAEPSVTFTSEQQQR
jgi:hypothetical protein